MSTPLGPYPTYHWGQRGSLAVVQTDPTFQLYNSESLHALRPLKDAKQPINPFFFVLHPRAATVCLKMRVHIGLRGNAQHSDDMSISRPSPTRQSTTDTQLPFFLQLQSFRAVFFIASIKPWLSASRS